MPEEYIKHVVVDMDESMVQNCVLCGETICDYRGAVWPIEQSSPKGWGSGDVFLSVKKNPTMMTSVLSNQDTFKPCM